MDLRKLKTLIDLVSDSNVSELEITEAEGKVRIVKASTTQVVQTSVHPSAGAVPTHAHPAMTVQQLPTNGAQAGEAIQPATVSGHSVKSPMVGTFYRASAPETPPFVEVGAIVKEGQTLCIIEAMKILNEIESDKAGVIKQILVENGEAVEYGQPIFIIE